MDSLVAPVQAHSVGIDVSEATPDVAVRPSNQTCTDGTLWLSQQGFDAMRRETSGDLTRETRPA